MFCVWSFGGIVTDIEIEDTLAAQEAIRTSEHNYIAFAARLTQHGLADRSLYYFINDVWAALEEEPDKRAKAYRKQGPGFDVYVPLAGIWILLCGNVIFGHCRGPGTPLRLAGYEWGKGGKNWKGESGFSIERWIFWKKRFGEIKGHDQASENIKEMAAGAEGAMNRIENELADC